MKYNYEYVKPQQILAHQTKQLLQSNANKSASPKDNGKGKWKRFAESSINVYAVYMCVCVCMHKIRLIGIRHVIPSVANVVLKPNQTKPNQT